MLRRSAAVLCVLSITAALLSTALAAPADAADEAPFIDVSVDHPFVDDIVWLAGEGITTGYADGTFRPASSIKRQAMAVFLYRFADAPLGEDPPCAAAPFTDVPTTHPFCGEIAWLVNEGIAEGFTDGTFRPTQTITRRGVAAFLSRFADGSVTPCSATPFPDVPTTHPFCGEIAWLAENGITTGHADGTFRPANPVTRASMAAFLHRLSLLEPTTEAVSWEFVPGAVMLEPGEVAEVRLVGFDAEGQPATDPIPPFTLDSTSASLATLLPGEEGAITVTAGAELGVALTTATVDGIVTDPLTITVADVADGVVGVPDDQILFPPPGGKPMPGVDETGAGPFTRDEIDARRFAGNEADPGEDPVSFLSGGTRFPYVITGDAPALGTVLLGTGGTALMGKVVEPDGLPSITRAWNGTTYTLVSIETVPFTVAFDALKADLDTEDLDAIGVLPEVSGDFCDPATDPTCDPTPEIVPGDPVVEPYTGPTAEDPSGSGGAAPLTTLGSDAVARSAPAGRGAASALASEPLDFEVAGMKCKASPTFSPAALKLESFQPNFTHYLVLNIDVGADVSPYVRFEAGGRAAPTATFSITLQAAGGGQVECEVGDGLKYIAPIQGPWALLSPAVKVQPTLEASIAFSGGPRLRTEFTASGNARIHAGFVFDPLNRYGQNPDGPFRPVHLIDGPHFSLTPTTANLDIGVGDGSPWTYELTAGAYVKVEIGIQFGGRMWHDFLAATGQQDASDEFFSPLGNFKAGVRARATYESDGVVLNSKSTNSFVGFETDVKIAIEPKFVNDILAFLTNGSVSFSLEIPLPLTLKLPLFQPVVMKDPVFKVDNVIQDGANLEVTTGQTIEVRTDVDPVKTFSFTGSLAEGTLWEPGTISHVRSDVIDLRANAGPSGSSGGYLDGQVTVTDELCDQWREPKTFKMLALTRFDAAVGSIDTPSWAGEFTVKCVDPGIHFNPSTLSAGGTSTLEATGLPSANRNWEITSPLPEWLTASPMQGTFSSADDNEEITFTIEPPELDCDPVTLTAVVVASVGELDGDELDDVLTISQTFEPGPECDPPPIAGPGGAWGDPHMVTLDGLAYEGQVFGEYSYLEPSDGGEGLRIHARHEASAEGMLHGAKVTSVTAVAVQFGGHVFEAYLRPYTTQYIDGIPWDPVNNSPVEIGPGFTVVKSGSTITLTTPDHSISLAGGFRGIFDVSVTVPADGSLHGMLGIPDGDQSNDRTRRDGVVEPNFDDVDSIRRFTDSWWLEQAADTLLTAEPLTYRYDGPDRFPQPITDEELAPSIAEVQSAINPPVCTLEGAGAANYDTLVRNLALDRYVWGRPLGDLTGYSCTYLVEGSISVDLGLPADQPVTGLEVEVSAPGLDPCVTAVGTNGRYRCLLRPANGVTEPPDMPIVADVVTRWPGDPAVVGSTTASFTELAPFMASVSANADLVLGPESFVVLDLSGTIARDGSPAVVGATLSVDTDAPAGKPDLDTSTSIITEPDGTWSSLVVAPHWATHAEATLTIDEAGIPMVFSSAADVSPGINALQVDASYDRRTLNVTGTLTRDGTPYEGPAEVTYSLRDANGIEIGYRTQQVTTSADGTYASSITTAPTVASAVVRVRVSEITGPVDFTVTAVNLVDGANPVVLDGSWEHVQLTVSGNLVKNGAPFSGPIFLAVHSYSGPYTTQFDTTYLSSSGYGGTADENGDYQFDVALPEATRQVGIRLDADGQSFPLDHIAVLPGQANLITHDVDTSRPTLALSGTIADDAGPYTQQFPVTISAYKANPGGGDPLFISSVTRYVTADASGNWVLDEVLPRETVNVRLRVDVGSQTRTIESPIVMGVNPVTFDVDLSHATIDVSGVMTRNGAPLDTVTNIELVPYIHTPGGNPEWFALDPINVTVDSAADGSYSFSRDLPGDANHVKVISEFLDIEGAPQQIAVDVVSGSTAIDFDLVDDRPVLDYSGTVLDEAGPVTHQITINVFAYREPDEPGGDPVYLNWVMSTYANPDGDGHYQIDDVVLPAAATRVSFFAWVNGEPFMQWEPVTIGDNSAVFDIDATRTLIDISGELIKNGEGMNDPVSLTIEALEDPGTGDPPTLLATSEIEVYPTDGLYELDDFELPEGTNLVSISAYIAGEGNSISVEGVGPGNITTTFDLDITTAELRLSGRMLYEDGSPHTDWLSVVVWPDDGSVPEPSDHPDAISLDVWPGSDGSYSIQADMPPDTDRIGVWVKPTADFSSSTAFDAVPGINSWVMDWTFTRPLVQLDGTVTVDGVPYTDELNVESWAPFSEYARNEYVATWDSGAGAYQLDARLPLGSTTGRVALSFFIYGLECRVVYDLPSIDPWAANPLAFDWVVDTSDENTCHLLG